MTGGSLDVGLTFSGDISVGEVSFSQSTPGISNGVVINDSVLPTGAATQSTLAEILAKILAEPATEAKQDTEIVKLTSIDGKVATQTTLAAILAKMIDAPATEATLAALSAKITEMNSGATVIQSGNITNTPVAASVKSSTAYEASNVIKASAGALYSISGYNSGPAQFIQIHNTTTLPVETAVPIAIIPVPAQSGFQSDFALGIPCSTGITICNSTTGPTKTIGSANLFLTALFK